MGIETFDVLKVLMSMGICHYGGCHEIRLARISGLLFMKFVVVNIHHLLFLSSVWAEWLNFLNKICAFFGHRDTPITPDIENRLEKLLYKLLEQGVNEFWCGDQGNFDWLSRIVLKKIQNKHPNVIICYIAAYNPCLFSKEKQQWIENNFDILFPDEVAQCHPKYALKQRNRFVCKNADIIICYVEHMYGGAFEAVQIAKKLNKKIINIFDSSQN